MQVVIVSEPNLATATGTASLGAEASPQTVEPTLTGRESPVNPLDLADAQAGKVNTAAGSKLAVLHFSTAGMEQTEGAAQVPILNITTPIRYKSTKPDPLLDVRELDLQGREVHYHAGGRTYYYLDKDGHEVNIGPEKPATKWMTFKEGKPVEEASKLHNTQDIFSEALIPATEIESYHIHEVYEVFPNGGEASLYEVAVWLKQQDKIIASTFTNSGYKSAYTALLLPHFEGEKWELLMYLADGWMEYPNLQAKPPTLGQTYAGSKPMPKVPLLVRR